MKSYNFFKNRVTYKVFAYKLYIYIYIYWKQDLALNNPKGFIYH